MKSSALMTVRVGWSTARATLVVLAVSCGGERRPSVEVIEPVAVERPVASMPGRITSADGSFTLQYPPRTFTIAKASGDAVDLTSTISEPAIGMGDGPDVIYAITLAKLREPMLAALAKIVDGDVYRKAFPQGTEASFTPEKGYLDREPDGYRVATGVEGVGDEIHLFKTSDGLSWRFDCHFCCGLVANAKMTKDDQISLCADIMHAFARGRSAR
jgi:hypothetical protein